MPDFSATIYESLKFAQESSRHSPFKTPLRSGRSTGREGRVLDLPFKFLEPEMVHIICQSKTFDQGLFFAFNISSLSLSQKRLQPAYRVFFACKKNFLFFLQLLFPRCFTEVIVIIFSSFFLVFFLIKINYPFRMKNTKTCRIPMKLMGVLLSVFSTPCRQSSVSKRHLNTHL